MFVGRAEEDVEDAPPIVELPLLAVRNVCVGEAVTSVVPLVVIVWFRSASLLEDGDPEMYV